MQGKMKNTDDTAAEAIRACAADYIEGWYSGDAERMARCLHADLDKRIVVRKTDPPSEALRSTTAAQMIEWTRGGRGTGVPEPDWKIDIRLLDREEDMAAVRVSSARFTDYLHLAKFREGWRIVNVLWRLHHGK